MSREQTAAKQLMMDAYAKLSSYRTYVKLKERRETILKAINKALKNTAYNVTETEEGFFLAEDKKLLSDSYKEPEEALAFLLEALTAP